MSKAEKKALAIDPSELREGTCRLYDSPTGVGKLAVCKEKGKLKIYEVEQER